MTTIDISIMIIAPIVVAMMIWQEYIRTRPSYSWFRLRQNGPARRCARPPSTPDTPTSAAPLISAPL